MTLSTGTRVGPYEITSPLGAGGMGEVYRARDSRLGRDVAVKVLPGSLANDPDRLRRFEQEARSASLLNHPNILAIHDVGTHDGVPYVVSELLLGDTLRQRMGAPLPPKRAVEYALQVAQGLAAAHEKGIVHRDLKPENLFVTNDGRVKILDFGLAKLEHPAFAGPETDAGTLTRGTDPGVVLGTVGYMSPEQVRGRAANHRSDIFSFGAVLYEMLTGRRAFKGETAADTMTAILKEEPPDISETQPNVAPALERIVRHCLEKSPEGRFQSARDLAFDLEAIQTTSVPSEPLLRRGPLALRTMLLIATLLGLAIATGLTFRDRRDPLALRFSNPVQVTSAVGVEELPAWSPDGRTLAYQSNQTGNWDIWLIQVGGGEPLNRTAGYSGNDRFPSWSPDGLQIAFWSEREGEGYFVMPALAGVPRKVASAAAVGPAHWSRDGAELTYVTAEGGVFFETVSLRTGQTRRIDAPGKAVSRLNATWSPDERLVAFMDAGARNSDAHALMLLRLADMKLFVLTDGMSRIWSVSWSPEGNAIDFVWNRGGSIDLWRQAVTKSGDPQGAPKRITTGLGIRSATISPDGRKLAYSQGRRIANLWKAPILAGRLATWADARQLTFDQAYVGFVSATPDRAHLLLSSDRQGDQELWMMSVEGGEMRRLTFEPSAEWSPVASPDGREIAFYSNRSGSRDVWVMPFGGGPARQVTHDESIDFHPDWSPDGKNLVFVSGRSGNRDIWVTPAQGGEARPLAAHPATDLFPKWSPDGRWIVFQSTRSGATRLWRVRPEGGEPEQLTRETGGYPRWSPDGVRIYFVDEDNLWSVGANGGHERPMTDFIGRPGTLNSLTLATDGKSLFFTWDDDVGDLWVMDVEEGKR